MIEREPTLTLGRSDVEQHLRDALTHIAAAEALLQVDGAEAHPSLQTLTTQIIARTVAIEAVDETHEIVGEDPHTSNGSDHIASNGHVLPTATPPTEQTQAPFPVPTPTGTNGNGTAPSPLDHPSEAEMPDSEGSGIIVPPSDDADMPMGGDVTKQQGLEEPAVEPTVETDYIDTLAEKLNLSEREVSMLEAILAQAPRDEWFSTGQITFSKADFVSEDAFRNAKAKLFLALRDEVLIHNGKERGQSRYMVDSKRFALAGIVSDEPDRETIPAPEGGQDTEVPEGSGSHEGPGPDPVTADDAVIAEKTSDTPPEVKYEGDVVNDRRTRRNDIIVIENLDELNEWVSGQNPYGALPTVSIESPRLLDVHGKKFGLGDEQRELLNILLANYGKPLTQTEIFEQGFADIAGTSQRMKAFSGTIERFLTTKVDDAGNRLMLGDKLNGRGFMLNPVFRIVDNRESVKKN